MAAVYVDPDRGSNGNGSLATPFNTWASASNMVAGNEYLQAENTTWNGTIGPTGTGGTAGNRIVIGVYDRATGGRVTRKGSTKINAAGQSFGINITQARPYITVEGFEIYGATSANITKTATNNAEDQFCEFVNLILRDSPQDGLLMNGRGNRAINCDVYGNGQDGVRCVGNDIEILYCNIYNNGTSDVDGDGLQLLNCNRPLVQGCVIDHTVSAYKQALIHNRDDGLATGGRFIGNTVSVAQYDAAVPLALRALQVLLPGCDVIGNTVTGGQYGISMEGTAGKCRANVVVVTGATSVGIIVKGNDTVVQCNTVIGANASGSIGIDHNSAVYTGVQVNNNALSGWPQAIRTADTGATYSGNAFEACAVRNSNLAGGERAAGANDITAALEWSSDYKPRAGSPLLTGGSDIGYVRDIGRRQGKKFVGAHVAASLVAQL